ncbi:hypothetical protein HaLaN_00596, partial [Haematococcus lacustris]
SEGSPQPAPPPTLDSLPTLPVVVDGEVEDSPQVVGQAVGGGQVRAAEGHSLCWPAARWRELATNVFLTTATVKEEKTETTPEERACIKGGASAWGTPVSITHNSNIWRAATTSTSPSAVPQRYC